ncbi:MAG: SusD/RagB family nutrient-binding outer membrane lipoprotein, partial [Muribaculaceae bacterium]
MMFTQENWNDMRRYDYNPNVFLAWNKPYEYGVSSKTTIPEGQYPRRWKVSLHEYRYNTANLDAACPTDLCNLVGASTGKNWWNAPSMWVIPVWWDSNLK